MVATQKGKDLQVKLGAKYKAELELHHFTCKRIIRNWTGIDFFKKAKAE